MKKLFLITCLLALAAVSASADTITVTGNPTGSDSWSLSSGFSTGSILTLVTTGNLEFTAIHNDTSETSITFPGTFTIVSSPLTSAFGGNALFDPDPNDSSTFGTVSACYPGPDPANSGGPYCFGGTIQGLQILLNSNGTASFSGVFVVGQVDPAILNAIGAPLITGVTGSVGGTLGDYNNGKSRGGKMGGLTSTIVQGSEVPEPASMVLLGTGLLGAGRFVRRKFVA